MHIQTHILAGWCVANALPCTPRQRLLAMIASSICDVDGISYAFGQEAYWTYHHTFGHNVFFGLLASVGLACTTPRRWIFSFLLCLVLFHAHLLMDYYGSGPDWHIHYLWPLKGMVLKNPSAWAFYSWQNMLAFLITLIGTLLIAWRMKRTPLECITPGLNDQLLGFPRGSTARMNAAQGME